MIFLVSGWNNAAGCPVPNPDLGTGIIAGLALILTIAFIHSYIKDQP